MTSDAGNAQVVLARRLVEQMGGRYSIECGIDVDAGDSEVERWFVAATLFGSRISSSIAGRTFHALECGGLTSIAGAARLSRDELVALLDQGGYARYDFRMADRLEALAGAVAERYDGRAALIGSTYPAYQGLHQALDDLPGWGPVTIQVFLRELRGVWPGARPPLDPRCERATRHLDLLPPSTTTITPSLLARLAERAGLDPRDLESGLVRLALAHHDRWEDCPGGPGCRLLNAIS